MAHFEYSVLLKPDENGGYVVTCRDLPQLITQGEDIADALKEASDAMDEVFAAYMIGDLSFPQPSKKRRGEYKVAPPAETMAKAALYVAMKEACGTKVSIFSNLCLSNQFEWSTLIAK